jgi:hypothetical protein
MIGSEVDQQETAKAGQALNRRFSLEVPIATIVDFHNSAVSLPARPQQCAEGALSF